MSIPTESGIITPEDTKRWLASVARRLGGIPVSDTNSPCPVVQEDLHLVVSWAPRQRADQVTPYCHRHRCSPSAIIEELAGATFPTLESEAALSALSSLAA